MSKPSSTNYSKAYDSKLYQYIYRIGIIPTVLGDYCGGVHLFPFRTEKLSPPAQMVLDHNPGEYVVADFQKAP